MFASVFYTVSGHLCTDRILY